MPPQLTISLGRYQHQNSTPAPSRWARSPSHSCVTVASTGSVCLCRGLT